MIQSSLENKPADAKAALHDIMLDKIKDHLEAKRMEIAKTYYGGDDDEEAVEGEEETIEPEYGDPEDDQDLDVDGEELSDDEYETFYDEEEPEGNDPV